MQIRDVLVGLFIGVVFTAGAEPLHFKTPEEREYLQLALRCEGALEVERRHAEADLAECRRRLDGERQKVQTATVVCAPVCPACSCDVSGSLFTHGLTAVGGVIAGGALCALAYGGGGVVVTR